MTESIKEAKSEENRLLMSIIILGAILVVASGIFFFVFGDTSSDTQLDIETNYSEDGVFVDKTGDDTVQARITYRTGESKNITVEEDRRFIQWDKPVEDVRAISFYSAEKLISESEPPVVFRPEDTQINLDNISVRPNEPLRINALDNIETDAEIEKFVWKYNRTTETGESTVLEFSEPKLQPINLTVTNEYEESTSESFYVDVKDPDLINNFSGPSNLTVGEPLKLSADDYTSDNVSNYYWTVKSEDFSSLNYVPNQTGELQITLVARDAFGYEQKETRSIQVVEDNTRPNLSLSYNIDSLSADVSLRGDNISSFDTFRWNPGDGRGILTTDPHVEYNYPSSGNYNLSVVASNSSEQYKKTTLVSVGLNTTDKNTTSSD